MTKKKPPQKHRASTPVLRGVRAPTERFRFSILPAPQAHMALLDMDRVIPSEVGIKIIQILREHDATPKP